ncbi:uncharacterized protein [Mytilus edulis]|uniref:uncharacterized protein n=1 Tax=Mytilus edulis TaxID=6550 RepID=UPI0039F0EED3
MVLIKSQHKKFNKNVSLAVCVEHFIAGKYELYKNLSLQFYYYLCDIIGSEEVVRTRREIFSAKDIVDHKTLAACISSGSKAEGLDIKGSDYDQMILLSFIRVCESFNNVQYDSDQLLLVMDTDDTKPGFTKLKLVQKSDSYMWLGRNFQYFCVFTFHYTLVTLAVQYGVLFVPIGCKNSQNENLQWRISFSVTEKLLIHSFSHTQLLCYALMKIILKDLIKPRHGDLLCSYFIKTIMFWLSEETHSSQWKPENMIPCFLDCIRRLIYCVEYRTCLHFLSRKITCLKTDLLIRNISHY